MPWWPGWTGWTPGRGWRWCFWATGVPGWIRWGYPRWNPYPPYQYAPSEEDELKWLEEEEKLLEEELDYVRRRIRELRDKDRG